MEKRVAEFLVDLLESSGKEARLYEGYSGRGMYGKTTTGVVLESFSDLAESMWENSHRIAHAIDSGDLPECIDGFAKDSMGYDTIIY